MSELKPCPFCGGEPTMELKESTWIIECKNHGWEKTDDSNIEVAGDIDICSCVLNKKLVDNRAKRVYCQDDIEKARNVAINAWNRRAEKTCRIVECKQRLGHTQVGVKKSCSECGFMFGFETHYERLFAGMVLNEVDPPNYCPNCGARVEEGE